MTEALINEIIQGVNRGFSPRLRIAVTPEEYQKIRAYCLNRYGRFHGKLLNLPLIVEEEPPINFFELKQDSSQ